MRPLATLAASLLLVATPSLAFSLPAEDTSSIFARSNISTTSSSTTSSYHFDERSGILTEYGPSSSLSSTLGKRDTFTASFGLMLERDLSTDPRGNKFQKRRVGDIAKRTRDAGREVHEVGFTKRGELVLPETVLEKRAKSSSKKKNKKNAKKGHANKNRTKQKNKKKSSPKMNRVTRNTSSKKKSSNSGGSTTAKGISKSLVKLANSIPRFSAFITWYTGVDLQKPYCADRSGWTPKDSALIAAFTLDYGKGKPACGSFLQLKSPSNNKSVIVRLVDMCGGCKPGIAHVDLSKAAFQKLFSLDVGKVGDIEVSTLSGPPFKEWTNELKALYGPQLL
ncbi:hypothetical protein JCM16303_001301 [Sporobolomyces ruberrimus]